MVILLIVIITTLVLVVTTEFEQKYKLKKLKNDHVLELFFL